MCLIAFFRDSANRAVRFIRNSSYGNSVLSLYSNVDGRRAFVPKINSCGDGDMTDSSGNTNATTGVPAAVDRVAVRIPEFCPGDPEMWFSMIERSFEASGVMSENTKFGYVLGALNTRYAAEVRDIIMNPPASEPYTKLKIEFIRRLSVSQEQKTRRLLEHEEIGDRKPSQFLRHLRELAGTAIPDNVLRTLWMGRLPGNMQVILTTQRDTELDKVAELADAIAETMTPRSHIAEAAITGPNTHRQPPPSDWEAALNIKMAQMALSLRQEISAIRESLFNDGPPSRRRWTHRRRSNSRHRGRSSSRSRERNTAGRSSHEDQPDYQGKCWYHWRHGPNAHRCIPPCNWNAVQGNDEGSR
ncbi:hypothetical protein ANTPLA_LOCUS10611 [Anthophora plagiata]